MDLYPLFLRLRDRRVLVVGAGSVGARKVRELLAVGAEVVVVAPAGDIAGVEIARREFVESDLDGVWLVIAATNHAEVNRAIAAAAEQRRIFVNAVDDPPNASAFFGAVIRRAPFLIAISSSGELPAMSRLLREVIEAALPSDAWVERARVLRKKWKTERTPMGERFSELVRAISEAKP
jgi:siroheme synthase-like protein